MDQPPMRTYSHKADQAISVHRSKLLHDADDSLHAEQGVLTSVLGVHEADLDVYPGLGCDRLLLKSFVRERPGKGRRWSDNQLSNRLFLAREQVLDGLLGSLHVLDGRRDVHVHEEA